MTALETTSRDAPSAHAPNDVRALGLRISRGWITGLSLLISFLALGVTAIGIFTADGQHHRTFVSLRGVTVTLQGGGLYANESVSGAAQVIGQDVITLFVAVPLLLLATYLAAHGSLRGRLLQTGLLWYFGYTYLLMAFGATYNPFFLVYVVLYSASIFAFLLSLLSFDVSWLRSQFSARFARRTVGWMVIGFGALLSLLWVGRILPALAAGTPPVGLDAYSTLFVQAGDLGLVVPLAMISGVLLLRRSAVGYLLAGVLLIKGATLGLALMAMIVALAIAGEQLVPVEVGFFVTLAVVFGAGAIHLLMSLSGRQTIRY